MNIQQLNTANIKNLTRLWQLMGASHETLDGMAGMQISNSWPYRCWFDSQTSIEAICALTQTIEFPNEDYIMPLWVLHDARTEQLKTRLKQNDFEVSFKQTAMYLDLNNHQVNDSKELSLKRVDAQQEIQTWTEIAALAFGYAIDSTVIINVAKHTDIYLYMAHIDNQPAVTAMLYKTGDVTGIHQMGVLPELQGQGIARNMMQAVIKDCAEMSSRYITLQASEAGLRLYRSLGFKHQFMIHNYKRQAIPHEE